MANATSTDVTALDELTARLAELDRQGVMAVIDGALACGATLDRLVGELLAPAQVEMGRRWAAGELGAVETQVATAIVHTALGRVISDATLSDRPVVAVACPEGERHQLPAEMVTELLRVRGWPAEYIGRPVAGLRRYLASRRPAALLLSCSTPCGLAGAARAIDLAHQCGVGVVVGGAAFGRDDRRSLRLGAAAWAPTVGAAAVVLDGWQDRLPELSLGRALSEDYLRLEAVLSQVTTAALGSLRRSGFRRAEDVSGLVLLRDRLKLLLTHLGAAVLVDDGRLFLDFLTWQVAFIRVRDVAGVRLDQMLEAVADALPEDQQAASRLVEDGFQCIDRRGTPAEARPLRRSPNTVRPAPVRPAPAPARQAAVFSVGSVAGPDVTQGQVFADLLFLAAMSCHAPIALIAVAQAEGQWSTLSYGVDRREVLSDPDLFAAVAAGGEPIEIQSLASHEGLGASPLATGPLAIRFVYGVPLRSRQDVTIGVFCVLDRRSREMSGREQQAMLAIARQVSGQLVLWRRGAGAPAPAPSPNAPNRRRDLQRKGPDAALADLVGLRRAGFGVEQHLLRSHEVAVLFDVTERTVINWAASDKLASLRTAGGHLRFRSDDVLALLDKRAGTATG